MKTKILILVIAIVYAINGQAQITLENSYTPSANSFLSVVNFASSGYKYQLTDPTNNQVRFYNLNHSLWKTINVTPPVGYTFNSATFASETLFNANSNIEVVCTFYQATPADFKTQIVDETGAIIFALPNSCAGGVVKSTGANGWKLIVTNMNPYPTVISHDVYSLPGTYPTQIVQPSGDYNFEAAYPNPAQSQITIPYNLSQGSKGQIIIYDITGKEIQKYDIDNTFSNLNLYVSLFSRGIYIYKIFVDNNLTESKKFIIN